MTVMDIVEALRDAAPTERDRRRLPKLSDLARMYYTWENDTYGVSERYQLLFCRVFDMTLDQLLADATMRSPSLARSAQKGQTEERRILGDDEEDDVERRLALQALAVLGTAATPLAEALRTVHRFVESGLGRNVSTQLDDWEAAVADYGFSYLALPPQQLLPELATDLVAANSITPKIQTDHPEYPRRCGITADLSLLMARTLGNLGRDAESRGWWRTAQHAADASGDGNLMLRMTSQRLYQDLYRRRPAALLIRQATDAVARTGATAGDGLASINTLRAQALAVTGQRDAAARALRDAEEAYAQLPPDKTRNIGSTWNWGEDRLRYSEAWMHAHLGDVPRLESSADRTVALLRRNNRRSTTQVNLLRAVGHVRTGDVTQGIALAGPTYEACPPEHRLTFVRSLANDVLRAAPADQRNNPKVAEYRELIAAT